MKTNPYAKLAGGRAFENEPTAADLAVNSAADGRFPFENEAISAGYSPEILKTNPRLSEWKR
jgi:hypothetical protein